MFLSCCNFAVVLQHSYGFIRCLERESRLFFHYSEFGGDADTMRTGGSYLAVFCSRFNFCVMNIYFSKLPSVLWCCWLGGRKSIRPVKNWVVRCWCGYLFGTRCRLAHGPADATATHCLLLLCPVWARGRCRISPPRFLAECCKRQLNQVSLVLLHFRFSVFSDFCWVCLSVFSCTVLFVSISQVIGCEDHLRNDLYCVGWGIKLYSNQTKSLLLQ